MDDLNRLDLERSTAILSKSPDNVIQTNISFRSIESCDLNQNVFSVDCDFRVFTVDDGRNRANNIIAIQNQRINLTISNEMKIFL